MNLTILVLLYLSISVSCASNGAVRFRITPIFLQKIMKGMALDYAESWFPAENITSLSGRTIQMGKWKKVEVEDVKVEFRGSDQSVYVKTIYQDVNLQSVSTYFNTTQKLNITIETLQFSTRYQLQYSTDGRFKIEPVECKASAFRTNDLSEFSIDIRNLAQQIWCSQSTISMWKHSLNQGLGRLKNSTLITDDYVLITLKGDIYDNDSTVESNTKLLDLPATIEEGLDIQFTSTGAKVLYGLNIPFLIAIVTSFPIKSSPKLSKYFQPIFDTFNRTKPNRQFQLQLTIGSEMPNVTLLPTHISAVVPFFMFIESPSDYWSTHVRYQFQFPLLNITSANFFDLKNIPDNCNISFTKTVERNQASAEGRSAESNKLAALENKAIRDNLDQLVGQMVEIYKNNSHLMPTILIQKDAVLMRLNERTICCLLPTTFSDFRKYMGCT